MCAVAFTSSLSRALIRFSYWIFCSLSSCCAISLAIWMPCIISSLAFNRAASISASSLCKKKKINNRKVYQTIAIELNIVKAISSQRAGYSLGPLGRQKLIFGELKVPLSIAGIPTGRPLAALNLSRVVETKVVIASENHTVSLKQKNKMSKRTQTLNDSCGGLGDIKCNGHDERVIRFIPSLTW